MQAIIYAVSGTDMLAKRMTDTLFAKCGKGVRVLHGPHADLEPDTVPLITSGSVNYEYGFIRELRKGDAHLGWNLVIKEHPWAANADVVVCVSPELAACGPQKEYEVLQEFLARGQKDEDTSSDPYGTGLWPKYD